MLNKRTIFFMLISFLGIHQSFAQENYVVGYVINLQQDTLRGFIDYRNWEKNPTSIHFKEKMDSPASNFTVKQIREFQVADEIYVSKVIDIETSSLKVEKLTEDANTHTSKDTAFLQTLIKGDKSLYLYNKASARNYFYIEKDNQMELLLYKKYTKTLEDKQVVLENKKYLEQLRVYFQECPSIITQLNATPYTKIGLIKIFQAYTKCAKTDISFQRKTEKISLKMGTVAGVSRTSLVFRSAENWKFLTYTKYSPSTNFTAGLFLDILLPKTQKKWSIYNELIFNSYKCSALYSYYNNANDYLNISTEFGYYYLKLNTLARFKYPIGKLHLLLSGGISNGVVLKETKNYFKQDIYVNGINDVSSGKPLEETRKHEQSLVAGMGIAYKHFFLDARYEWGNGMSSYVALNSKTRRGYLMLGYRF